MIEFSHSGVKIKCKPERAADYRRAIDAKPPKIRTVSEKRDYPKWHPEMPTSEYLRLYIGINDRRRMIACSHDCANIYDVPAMYDGAFPACLEEPDAAYQAPEVKAKPVKAKDDTQRLRAALQAIAGANPLLDFDTLLQAVEELQNIARRALV